MFDISLVHLKKNTTYCLEAKTFDDTGDLFISKSYFRSETGEISLSCDAPISGSYQGINPMGFIEYMEEDSLQVFQKKGLEDQQITLSLLEEHTLLDSAVLIQRGICDEIQVSQFHQGVTGKEFLPKLYKETIVIFPGSASDMNQRLAANLALKGYRVYTLQYFDKDRKQHLESIEIEPFIAFLQSLGKTILIGVSKGGELALLIGSLFPELFSKIVAYVPSALTYGGFPNIDKPCWVYRGISFPLAPLPPISDIKKVMTQQQILQATPILLKGLKNKKLVMKSMIAVENLQCPLLLISGKNDMMWPSSVYCQMILDRIKNCHRQIYVKNASYENCGHQIQMPYLPCSGRYKKHPIDSKTYDFGGTPSGNARAARQSWKEVISFLNL